MQHLKNLIEAALFIAAKPMTLEELRKVKGLEAVSPEELLSIIKSMEADYEHHGVRVVEEDGHFELRIKDEFTKHVEHLAPNKDFSRATLQTLSLIAYRSPVKQSEIIDVRGNRGYEHIKELLERGFIKSEPQGHTNVLSITQRFLDYFSLKNPEEVKDYFAKKIARDVKKQGEGKKDGEKKPSEESADQSAEKPKSDEASAETHMVESFEQNPAE